MAEIPWGGEDFVTDPPEEERVRYYSRAEIDEAVAKERAAAFAAGVQAGRQAERRAIAEEARPLVDKLGVVIGALLAQDSQAHAAALARLLAEIRSLHETRDNQEERANG